MSEPKQVPGWHYVPRLPITPSPYFQRPMDSRAMLRWILGRWFPLSDRLIILAFAVATTLFVLPDLARFREPSAFLFASIYARNLVLMLTVAGGLHAYFYIWRRQRDERRYDSRPLPTNSAYFSFGSQVRDNMFWSLASGVTVWSAYEFLMLWALANGYAPALSYPRDLVWLALMVFLLPIWETVYFYLIHRFIHVAPLYRRVHALHHRNTNVGPWSGLSMHPIEHVIYLGTVLIHFVVPSSPLLIVFHLQYFALSAATTHCGYQGITRRGRVLLPLGTFHHQLHHRYFECNYGGLEVPFDRWTGSFHDGTVESHREFQARRRRVEGSS